MVWTQNYNRFPNQWWPGNSGMCCDYCGWYNCLTSVPVYPTYPPPLSTPPPPVQTICKYGEPQKNSYGQTVLCNFDEKICNFGFWCHRGAFIETTVCCPKANCNICRK
ncbi:unnamed protein product [Soboliphyme baturini]|uniref:ShKT domain-containing protein n=1 Tax=Soboliphyme baturini TaxID=241478 RepID=A0A183IGI1_9BILA|nr:unnamed protein product [Soboliphyme baturini]